MVGRTSMAHRLLLDTSSLMFRAFFALPTSITDGAGRPVNAVRGYLDMTARLIGDRRPDAVAHVLDDDFRPAERVALYAGYKAQRRPDPPELGPQFELLDEVLDALGAERVLAEGWEADDAIGALCAGADPEDRLDVVTGDRDLLQLVRDEGPTVRVLYTVRGVSKIATFDEAAVRSAYGVPAARYVDFAILRGDPSDGLPGVPGVGEKTARTLVLGSPSLAELLDAAGRQAPRLALKLRAARDYIEAMQRVVPVRSDVPVVRRVGTRDPERLRRLQDEGGLDGPIQRISALL